jgi:glycosyltransferase involved in cell wall biosynthesis
MSVVYVLPILPPQRPSAEAISQEIACLRDHFGGSVVYVNPNRHLPAPIIPRLLFGWSDLLTLRRLGRTAALYHFYNPDPFPYPFLRALPKPVVYALGARVSRRPPLDFLRRMGMVTVPDAASAAQLRAWGLTNVARVRSGVDVSRFTPHPLPLSPETPLRVLVASAPWTHEQFTGKGFDALLAAAQRMPDLQLTLLWRGHLADVMTARIAASGLQDRVTLLDQVVDVNDVLATVHAAALLPLREGLVKSYPHSLLDALAAGKPIVVSPALALAEDVAATGCGVVVSEVTPTAIVAALRALRADYPARAAAALTVGRRDFTLEALRADIAAVYTAVAPGAFR